MSSLSTRLQMTIENRLKSVGIENSQDILNSIRLSNISENTQKVKIVGPFRGGEINRRLINIDSRFRANPHLSRTSNFTINLNKPIQNAVRIRISSVEIPNNYHFFSERRKNVTFAILYGDNLSSRIIIQINPGNYIASEMEMEINTKLDEANIKWLKVSWDGVQGFFYFIGTQQFCIDTTEQTHQRHFDYGLGYYLGFWRGVKTGQYDGTKYYTVCSEFYANFAGDNYLLLSINGLNCIQHQTDCGEISALGKIILREPKNYMVFDDNSNQHTKEVIFISPTNFENFEVQIFDPYGQEVDFQNANVSISMEIIEVLNISVFNNIRDGMIEKI